MLPGARDIAQIGHRSLPTRLIGRFDCFSIDIYSSECRIDVHDLEVVMSIQHRRAHARHQSFAQEQATDRCSALRGHGHTRSITLVCINEFSQNSGPSYTSVMSLDAKPPPTRHSARPRPSAAPTARTAARAPRPRRAAPSSPAPPSPIPQCLAAPPTPRSPRSPAAACRSGASSRPPPRRPCRRARTTGASRRASRVGSSRPTSLCARQYTDAREAKRRADLKRRGPSTAGRRSR